MASIRAVASTSIVAAGSRGGLRFRPIVASLTTNRGNDMTKNGYNAVALLAIVTAAAVNLLGGDKELAAGLVLLAGTVVGRGDKAAG